MTPLADVLADVITHQSHLISPILLKSALTVGQYHKDEWDQVYWCHNSWAGPWQVDNLLPQLTSADCSAPLFLDLMNE